MPARNTIMSSQLPVRHMYWHDIIDDWYRQPREPRVGETVKILFLAKQPKVVTVTENMNWIEFDYGGLFDNVKKDDIRGYVKIVYDEPFDDKRCWEYEIYISQNGIISHHLKHRPGYECNRPDCSCHSELRRHLLEQNKC